ncbi:MAG: hypothetical protein AAGA27_08670 [Pseudomonadota bacterium]
MASINYKEIPEFTKAFKKLKKRFSSLSDDLEVAKLAAIALYHVHHIDNNAVVEIPTLKHSDLKVLKLKKFACKSLKGKGVQSGIRIIYAFNDKKNDLLFLDIYYKGDRESENRRYLKSLLKTI